MKGTRRRANWKGQDMVVFPAYLPKETVKRIDHLAVDYEISRAALIAHVIEEVLAGHVDLTKIDPRFKTEE